MNTHTRTHTYKASSMLYDLRGNCHGQTIRGLSLIKNSVPPH